MFKNEVKKECRKMISIITSLDKRQFCPTIEDIENDGLKKLAKRLKGDSEKETLTNVLEWQDRNIQYWWERYPFDLSLKILIPYSSVLALAIILPFLLLLYELGSPTFALLLASLIVLFFFLFSFHNIMLKVFYLFLFLPIIYLFTSLALRIPILAQTILPSTLIYAGCLGAIALIMVYLPFRYRIFLREKPIKEKISKFFEVVNNTFRLSLPVDKILEYKLAVCRDYAKLTASLLFNLFPDSELYFVKIPSHVVTGIKIKNKLYVFDKRLPISSVNRWLIVWKKKKATIYKSRLKDSGGKLTEVTFDKDEPILRELPEVNTEKLTEEIAKMLGINQSSHKDGPDFEIPLSNYAVYYEDDEITKYSLIRAIKNRLESELCDCMDKISKIKISQNKKDLVVVVYL